MSINTIIPAAFLLLFQFPCFAISNSTQLSAYYESRNNSIRLKWQNNDNRVTIFVLQKSMDNIHWKDLYTIEKRGFSQHLMEAYTDGNPFPANNHYRLKINREDNSIEYESANNHSYRKKCRQLGYVPCSGWHCIEFSIYRQRTHYFGYSHHYTEFRWTGALQVKKCNSQQDHPGTG